MSHKPEIYQPKNHLRVLTAASLFDGHDASINIMRRIMQASGAEVIHLGHNRSAHEIVSSAIQEDVQSIAITSYQGGHLEFFKYIFDLLHEKGRQDIRLFGGGGGTILASEIENMEAYGITKIYTPEDGRKLGLQGMINDLLQKSDFPLGLDQPLDQMDLKDPKMMARAITLAENEPDRFLNANPSGLVSDKETPVIGITGTGGSGKSSLVDELIRRFVEHRKDQQIGIISVDPTKRKTGGALLGDRIRMNAIYHPAIFMRSLATRQAHISLSRHIDKVIHLMKAAGYDLIILESSGIGQSDSEIVDFADLSVYVMTPEFGAASQLEKIDMLDFADLVVINKFDKKGALDALKDVKKQYQRNHQLWQQDPEQMPVIGSIASQFNDPGMNQLFNKVLKRLNWRPDKDLSLKTSSKIQIIPGKREGYLAEISESVRNYNLWVQKQSQLATQLFALSTSIKIIPETQTELEKALKEHMSSLEQRLNPDNLKIIQEWPEMIKKYQQEEFIYKIRGKEIKIKTSDLTLSNSRIPKVALPRYESWGDILKWNLQENVPGEFPYTAGVFPFKRESEDPTRMFAGEGAPERTNHRFHYLCHDIAAKRLSTAFDSVTLYGNDPDHRPDIYGKVGNSGVSICSLDDAKKLYSGFNLADPRTSVSMTINGPAAIITAFFLNAAIDQQCEIYIRENRLTETIEQKIRQKFEHKNAKPPQYQGNLPEGNDGLGLMLLGVTGDQVLPKETYQKIKADTLLRVRGTVQADILKEDQAQNTCIFSTEFSLKLMGDVQQYFIDHQVQNFYSVSISGYHIAEAGANPITQLAFTLANGFTYVEYYLSRGMDIDQFAPNLSFFFSNGIDAEYAVIGRVARRIWAKAIKNIYGGNERSQKLKYHIQTSGRSLHAQEISFNDIRTTLQALYAIYDNCNSLHTNAYDEAITTPTEESVRKAMAIQLIINKELGLAKNENPIQGSFIIEQLTDLVEEAVMLEFDRLNDRGGVLGAMETMYQRNKIQEESLFYESRKHSGQYPIVGVNTFLSQEPEQAPKNITRATTEEKDNQIQNLQNLYRLHHEESQTLLINLKKDVLAGENIFDVLMEVTKYCSLGQITQTLFEVGGQYRRNM